MPGLVDTHCHLRLIAEAQEGDIPGTGHINATLAAAREAGVETVINIGLGDDNREVVATAAAHEGVYAAIGWHPHQERPPSDDELDAMATLATHPSVVAIGEIGLDYYWRPGYHEVPVAVQKAGFLRMLGLARQTGLPVAVHNREAHADTLELLADFADVRVVMHAFSGDRPFAEECVARGITASVAGPVTYPSAGALRDALDVVPTELLLVETDAPFLPPQPWRGKPSSPAMVAETARALAALKGLSLEDLALTLAASVQRIFGIGAGA